MSPEESVRQNEEVLCYFVFPELGHKVALRNLDILIFNPQEYHCVSKKVVDSDVFVLSLYMKTSVVGKNNNDLGLTPIEECIRDYLKQV